MGKFRIKKTPTLGSSKVKPIPICKDCNEPMSVEPLPAYRSTVHLCGDLAQKYFTQLSEPDMTEIKRKTAMEQIAKEHPERVLTGPAK